jgi:mono/diheme cytochrome c family protein
MNGDAGQAPPIHAQQRREHAEPREAANPIPWIVVILTALLLTFGVVYIARSTLDRPAAWGDGRQAAELAPHAAGGAHAASADGAAIYAARCVACHQATGTGVPRVFPPLAGSEWVSGKATTVAAIVLHGVTGPITVAGQRFEGTMPTFREQLGDAEIAAVLTYVRSQWGNQAAPISAEAVAGVRKATSARGTPFNGGAELAALP